MLLKGIGVLAGAAALVVLGVLGVARLTVPDEPTFAEGFEHDPADGDGEFEFAPTAIGARLEISGARESTVTLERTVDGPTYGLGDSTTKVFFTSDPLAIDQMSYDGLAFFPEPEDCELTEREHNEEAGLVAVQITCPELVDIRDNGSITLEGFAALPADLVIELDLPETGGTVTVGDEEWEIVDPLLFVGPGFLGNDTTAIEFLLWTREAREGLGFRYNSETGEISLATVHFDERTRDVVQADCTLTDDEVTVNPPSEYRELAIDCENVEVPDLGTVEITGSVVYEKFDTADP